MSSALIGHTGFVGGHLAAQYPFDTFFNSKNIEEIAGRSFDLLAVSAMPAAMWIANRDPNADRAVLDRLTGCLRQVEAERVVVMSTVAVYHQFHEVDEESAILRDRQTPYGRHRLMLEEAVAERFPRALAVRLPGLFGRGLKKNAIFDLLNGNEVHKINSASLYQYYNLERLWADVMTALAAGLKTVNFATEPVSIHDVARDVFDIDFVNGVNEGSSPVVEFDIQSRHAGLYGGQAGYLYDRRQVLGELLEFVRQERADLKLEHPAKTSG